MSWGSNWSGSSTIDLYDKQKTEYLETTYRDFPIIIEYQNGKKYYGIRRIWYQLISDGKTGNKEWHPAWRSEKMYGEIIE